MTIKPRDYGAWITEELQSLLDVHIYDRDHIAETYSERSDLNEEIQMIKRELLKRKNEIIHTK
tara:strand:+ start:112 stop:300 length:189 start_codon:yes stop_codon:yes gene_type:complete